MGRICLLVVGIATISALSACAPYPYGPGYAGPGIPAGLPGPAIPPYGPGYPAALVAAPYAYPSYATAVVSGPVLASPLIPMPYGPPVLAAPVMATPTMTSPCCDTRSRR